jgi:hypothetical protein
MKLIKVVLILGLIGLGIIATLNVLNVVSTEQAMDSAGKLTILLVIAAAVGGGIVALSGKSNSDSSDKNKQGPQF